MKAMTAEVATTVSVVAEPEKVLELKEPNATLYVSNIDWKIKKVVLRRALWTLFSRHGKIIEIITLRSEGLRGQAWVIFQQVTAATAALNAEQGFSFFGRNLKVAYAREKSDRIAKLDGTYMPKDRKSKRYSREVTVVGNNPDKKARMGPESDDGNIVTMNDPSNAMDEVKVENNKSSNGAKTEFLVS